MFKNSFVFLFFYNYVHFFIFTFSLLQSFQHFFKLLKYFLLPCDRELTLMYFRHVSSFFFFKKKITNNQKLGRTQEKKEEICYT